MIIESTPAFGHYDITGLTLTPLLIEQARIFFDRLYTSPSCMVYVNEKKVLLQQVHRNMLLQLSKRTAVKCDYLHNLYAGSFTNYKSAKFREPDSVFLILTKNHNQTELRLLKELEKTDIKVNVLTLGLTYYHPKFNVISVQNIKALYWLLYAYFIQDEPTLTFSEFSKRFVFSPERVDFLKYLDQ